MSSSRQTCSAPGCEAQAHVKVLQGQVYCVWHAPHCGAVAIPRSWKEIRDLEEARKPQRESTK